MLEFDKVKALADQYGVECKNDLDGKVKSIKIKSSHGNCLPKEFIDKLVQLRQGGTYV